MGRPRGGRGHADDRITAGQTYRGSKHGSEQRPPSGRQGYLSIPSDLFKREADE
jgi:hypothetical protein